MTAVTTTHPGFWFRAYGLVVSSTIPVPELLAMADGETGDIAADVRIRLGEVPEHLDGASVTHRQFDLTADELLLRVPDVGRYLIRRGREIVIDPDPSATDHDLRVFLLGTGFGTILHQRGFFVLHASGVALHGRALLFAGQSGAGKSTLLAELLRRGHRMLVDDVCAVVVRPDAAPVVVPSYPRTRLWSETASRFAIDTTDLPRVRPSWDKFERQLPDQFHDQDAPLGHVFELAGPADVKEVVVETLSPTMSFATLVNHTYRGLFLDGLELREAHFRLASDVARQVKVHRVWRPREAFSIEEVADRILERAADG